MESRQIRRSELASPGKQASDALVGRRGLSLLEVGQRQDPKREDLVDLGRVEEIAGALGGDLRVVVEDDRRGEHVTAGSARAEQHWKDSLVATLPNGLAEASGGSSNETKVPPETPNRAWAAPSVAGSAPSRSRLGTRSCSLRSRRDGTRPLRAERRTLEATPRVPRSATRHRSPARRGNAARRASARRRRA